MPVGSLEEVDEVDPEGLLGLTHLPVGTSAVSFQILTVRTDLVCQRPIDGLARQESAHSAHAVRGGLLLHQLRLHDKFAKLL